MSNERSPLAPVGRKRRQPSHGAADSALKAICTYLITKTSTREENRAAVRLLLRAASRNLERSR